MKKKILALALALIMIISLLPLTALAEDVKTPMPKVTVKGNSQTTITSGGLTTSKPAVYIQTVDGQLVKADEKPEDNYMGFVWNSTDKVLEITFKNINYQTEVKETTLIAITNNGSNYSNVFDVVLTLEGENVIESTSTGNEISVNNSGTFTITGSGSLRFVTSNGSGALFHRKNSYAGEMIIKDTTLYLENTYGSSSTAVIINNNQVTIEGSDVTLNGGPRNRGIITSTKWSTSPTNTEFGVTIKDSDFVYETEGSAYGIETAGPIVFDNSNIQMDRGEGNNSNVFNKAPTFIGEYSEISWRAFVVLNDAEMPWEPYADLGLEPGTVLDTNAKLRHFKMIHKHVSTDCTKLSVCPCGKIVIEPLGTSHSFTNKASDQLAPTSDCIDGLAYYVQCDNCLVVSDSQTVVGEKYSDHVIVGEYTAPTCTEPGYIIREACERCGKIISDNEVIPALDHLANPDDGDCTTAVTCQRCDNVVVAPEENHTLVSGESIEKNATCVEAGYKKVFEYCSECKLIVSSETVEIPATGHAGGTATCKELAKCELCGKEYGELAAHIVSRPDCSVACACSVCNQVIFQAGQHIPGEPVLDEETNELVTSCTACGKELSREADPNQPTENEGYLSFELYDDEDSYYVSACDESVSGEVVIPATYNGLPVTGIGEWAFGNCTDMTSVIIPNSITEIGTCAFGGCTGLTSVALPDSVTSTGDGTFYGCSNLTSVTIPNSVTTIGNNAFGYCTKLASITIPNSVTRIDGTAFQGCISLAGITIPDSVTTIGNNAFYGCTSLTNVTVPDSVTGIGDYAFRDCNSLSNVTYCGTQEQWDAISIGEDNHELTGATLQFHNPGAAADCVNDQICTICNMVLAEKTGHTVQVLPGVAAGCETTGLTEGKQCSVCGEITVPQEVIEAKGHTHVVEFVEPTMYEKGYTLHTCACGDSYKTDEVARLHYVALIGKVRYAKLQDAIDAAEAGDEIELVSDVTYGATLIINKNVTIDLNGYSYAVSDVKFGTVLAVEGGKVTLKSTGAAGELIARYDNYEKFSSVITNNGTLFIENVTVNGNNLFVAGTATIINNGTLTFGEGAELNVNYKTKIALVNNSTEAVAETAKVNAPQGYYWAPDNYSKLYAVAVNGNKLYTSLQTAIDAAANGDKVILKENMNGAATLIVAEGKEITIDLGGKFYAVKNVEQGAALVIGEGAKVTLTNGKLDAMYAAYEQFDCVIRNNGELTIENATINGNNLFNAGAAAILNNGTLTKGEGAVITVKKAAEVVDINIPSLN